MERLATAPLVAGLLVLLVVAGVAPTAVGEPVRSSPVDGAHDPAAGGAPEESHAGTHVSFAAEDRAVTDYAVRNETILDSLRVASERAVGDANRSPSNVTHVEGARLTVGATTDAETRVLARNGATVAAHDNRRGVLVVASGEGVDYAVADLPAGANATAESDSQVAVTTRNGTPATLLVVGEGRVAVNDAGGVTARLGDGGRLVLRAYPDGKTEADETRENLLASGGVAAELYVGTPNGNATGDETGGTEQSRRPVVDTVSYDDNATVEVAEVGEDRVALAVNRTTGEGTVLLASVSPAVLNASGGVSVAVDGETAAEAVTFSQLRSAVGSEQSRYLVERAGGDAERGEASSGAEGEDASKAVEVAVGVNRLDGRTVSLASAETSGNASTATVDSDESTVDAGGTTDGESASDGETATSGDAPPGDETERSDDTSGTPGFTTITAGMALVAGLLTVALLVRRA